MSELTQNINVRMTHQMKKRIMDEAYKREMKLSEYILFLIQDHWENESEIQKIKESKVEEIHLDDSEIDNFDYKEMYLDADKDIDRLEMYVCRYLEIFEENAIKIEKPAQFTSLVKRLKAIEDSSLEEVAAREMDPKLIIGIPQNANQLALNKQKIDWQETRIKAYETPSIIRIFHLTQGPSYFSHNIKDLPDVVNFLATAYSQQYFNNQYNV